jgi:serine/threonine-protein kinase
MSPEQIRSSKHVDQRTDIWALGVILYELLTGRLPFFADNVTAVSAQIVADQPPPPTTHRADLPEELEAVVLRCLEKDPDRRFANVAALATALAPFAPPSAQLSLERIGRLSQRDLALGATVEADSVGALRTLPMSTGAIGWGKTSVPIERRAATVVGGLVLLGVIVVAVVLIVGERADEAGSRPAPAPLPRASAAAAPAVPPAGSAAASSPRPMATASASADVQASATPGALAPPSPRRGRRPSADRDQPRCGPGEVLSRGHCCPTGLAWQNGRCQRPLATDVPF